MSSALFKPRLCAEDTALSLTPASEERCTSLTAFNASTYTNANMGEKVGLGILRSPYRAMAITVPASAPGTPISCLCARARHGRGHGRRHGRGHGRGHAIEGDSAHARLARAPDLMPLAKGHAVHVREHGHHSIGRALLRDVREQPQLRARRVALETLVLVQFSEWRAGGARGALQEIRVGSTVLASFSGGTVALRAGG